MKKALGSTIILLFFLLPQSNMLSQALNENFDYGGSDNADITAVTSNWVRHSGAQGPAYVAAGLSYTGYQSSGIGGCVGFTHGSSGTNDGDVNQVMGTDITTTSTVYASFLVNVSIAQSSADYFFHLGPATIGTTFRGRVFARSNGVGWSLGLSKSSETRVDDATVLNLGQTYLIVLKYEFSTSTTSDDQVTLYAYSSGVPSSEPGSPDVTIGPTGSGTTGDPSDIGTVVIRQSSNCPTAQIDGIRVATDWNLAPLPVEMTSFSLAANHLSTQLRWSTVTEINNFGFEIERKNSTTDWAKVGFVSGAGTSTSLHSYSFTDNVGQAGLFEYRLKQIDKSGSFKYSSVMQVEVGAVAKVLSLGDNYPNPFNPTTSIEFSVPTDGRAVLKVYNVLGQEVATLFDGEATAGRLMKATFDASRLSSGIYFSRLETAGQALVKRMMLVK